MRLGLALIGLTATLAFCRSSREEADLATVAQRFFSAASAGDSAGLAGFAADTLIYDDLRLIASEQPGLLSEAARGLELLPGGEVSSDSAYLFFRPTKSRGSYGLDVGLVRKAGTWRVYYVGLTGSDLRPATTPR